MSKRIYDELFNFYVINRRRENIHNIRSVIREHLKKEFPDRTWEDLSDVEKKHFKLVTMHDYLMKYTSNYAKANRNYKAENSDIIRGYDALIKQNEYINKLYRQYFDESATDEEQHEAHKEYCKDLQSMFPQESIPSFEDWKLHPLRLFDIQQSLINEMEHESQKQENYASEPIPQSSIDHIVVECLRKIIEDKYNVSIDVNSIEHCLEITRDIELLNSLPLQYDLIPDSNKSELEQNSVILHNNDLVESLRKLSELDFIQECN